MKTIEFCVGCHTPLHYIAPLAKYVQDHGGKCDQCGADFAKLAAMMVFQAQSNAQLSRQNARIASPSSAISFAPITGGFSLIKCFRNKMHGG